MSSSYKGECVSKHMEETLNTHLRSCFWQFDGTGSNVHSSFCPFLFCNNSWRKYQALCCSQLQCVHQLVANVIYCLALGREVYSGLFFVDNGCLLQQETMPTRLKQNSKGADREKKWNNELKTAKNCAESADIGLHLKWRWIQELRSISRRDVGHVLLIIPYQMTKEKKFHWIINIAPEEPRSCEGSLPSLLSRRLDRTCSSYTLSPSACRLVYALLSAVAAKVCLPSSLDSK